MSSLTPSLKGRAAQNMGRPTKNDADKKGRITLAIHKPIIKAMQAIADAEHRSLSGQVELILTDYVKGHKSMKKKLTA